MQFGLRFGVEKESNGKYGIQVTAVSPDGATEGRAALLVDATGDSAEAQANSLACALRGMCRTPVPGDLAADFLSQQRSSAMRFSVNFVIEKGPNGKYGIQVVAVSPDGAPQGRAARLVDDVYSSSEEAADRLVCSLRGMFRNPVPGNFAADFIFPDPFLLEVERLCGHGPGQ